jgi:hypothetical protein
LPGTAAPLLVAAVCAVELLCIDLRSGARAPALFGTLPLLVPLLFSSR